MKNLKSQLLVLPLIALFVACNSGSKPSEANTEKKETEKPEASHSETTDLVELSAEQLKIGNIALGKIEQKTLGQLLQVNGRLAVPAQNQVAVTGLLGGFVRTLPLLPGQPIKKGQILARIENTDLVTLQQDYAENASRLVYLNSEYDRQKELSDQNISALKMFQQVSADRNQVLARMKGISERLKLVGISTPAAGGGPITSVYSIIAPVSGVITNVSAVVGQYVQPADIIAQITSNEGVYAELTVFEKDLALVREGQHVSLTLNNNVGTRYQATIRYINGTIDSDRSVRVIAKLSQINSRLIPNTFFKAEIDLGDSKVPTVPDEAIVSAEGKDYILVVTDEKIPEEHEHSDDEKKHSEAEEHVHTAGEVEQHSKTFRRIPVQKGASEAGYTQVILSPKVDIKSLIVVIKGAYAVLSQLDAAGGEEEGHTH